MTIPAEHRLQTRRTLTEQMIGWRDSGQITPWEEMGRGLGGRRTYFRSTSARRDECLLIVRGKPREVCWGVCSDGQPTILLAGGVVRGEWDEANFSKAQALADEALTHLNLDAPSTFTPKLSSDDKFSFFKNDLDQDAILGDED